MNSEDGTNLSKFLETFSDSFVSWTLMRYLYVSQFDLTRILPNFNHGQGVRLYRVIMVSHFYL